MIEDAIQRTLKSILGRDDVLITYVPSDALDTVTVRRLGANDILCYHRSAGSGRVSRPTVQIYIQNPDYTAGMAICEMIVDKMDGITHDGVTTFGRGGIIYVGKTHNLVGETHMYSLNFDCVGD